MNGNEKKLREELANALDWRRAHANLSEIVAQIAPSLRGSKPDEAPHTPWQLLEHLRLCQKDILEYCRRKGYESLPFPEGYWPAGSGPDERQWDDALRAFFSDLEEFRQLLLDPSTQLFSAPPGEEGPSILHEAILLIDHNAYHLGQLVLLLRLLDAWEEKPLDL